MKKRCRNNKKMDPVITTQFFAMSEFMCSPPASNLPIPNFDENEDDKQKESIALLKSLLKIK